MGVYEQKGNDLIYRQQSGEATARFVDYEEKAVLAHKGSARYKKIFYVLAAAGVLYLVVIFAAY